MPQKVKVMMQKLKSQPVNETILLAAAVSIFMPFLVTCTVFLGVCVYIVTQKELMRTFFKDENIIFLVIFAGLVIIVPLVRRRWLGLGAAIFCICGIIFLLFAQRVMTEKLYHRAFNVCCVMSIWCFLVAVVQKIVMRGGFRATAGLLNANYYATIIEFVVLICVYMLISEPTSYKRYIPIIAINIIGLFLSDCQSAWLPIIGGVLVLLYFNGYKKHTAIFLIASITFLVILVMTPGVLPRLDRLPETFKTRLGIWETAVNGIKLSPFFGRGTLGYMDVFERFGGYKTYHAHSLYIDPLLSFGIVGTSVLLGYLFMSAKTVFRRSIGENSRRLKSMMLAAVAAVCIHGITDYSIFWVQTGMLLILILGASGINYYKEETER